MSEGVTDPVVGVVEGRDDSVPAAVEAGGGVVRTGPPSDLRERPLDAMVTVGERALTALVADDHLPSAPVLPVEAPPGITSVPTDSLADAVGHVAAGECTVRSLPVLSVAVDDTVRTHALLDVTLVTAEPARISEYRVVADDRATARFRADGVVVATPAGSHGYTRAVDGPVLGPEAEVLAVTPIAPFATDADHWAVRRPLRLSVERDEAAVELLADDRTVCPVTPTTPVVLSRAGSLSVLDSPASRAPFERS